MKKIALLIPTLTAGGAERAMSRLSIFLESEFDVYFITFDKSFFPSYQLGGKWLQLSDSQQRPIGIYKKILAFWERYQKLSKLKRELKLDICISALEGANYLNVMTSHSEKVIISARGSSFFDTTIAGFSGKVRHLILPFFYKRADMLVSVSKGVDAEHSYLPSCKKVVIPPSLPEQEILELSKEELSLPEPFLHHPFFVYHGRLAEEKRVDFLLYCFQSYKESGGIANFVVVGDGSQREKLLNLSIELGIADSVLFTGYKKKPFNYIRGACASLLASTSEGFGNAIIESLCLNVPVYAADVPYGPAEIIAGASIYQGENKHIGKYSVGTLLPSPKSEKEYTGVAHYWAEAMYDIADKKNCFDEEAFSSVINLYKDDVVFNLWKKVIEDYV